MRFYVWEKIQTFIRESARHQIFLENVVSFMFPEQKVLLVSNNKDFLAFEPSASMILEKLLANPNFLAVSKLECFKSSLNTSGKRNQLGLSRSFKF